QIVDDVAAPAVSVALAPVDCSCHVTPSVDRSTLPPGAMRQRMVAPGADTTIGCCGAIDFSITDSVVRNRSSCAGGGAATVALADAGAGGGGGDGAAAGAAGGVAVARRASASARVAAGIGDASSCGTSRRSATSGNAAGDCLEGAGRAGAGRSARVG